MSLENIDQLQLLCSKFVEIPVRNVLHSPKLLEKHRDPKPALIFFDEQTSITIALQIMAANNILSAPVFDRLGENCLGCVDVLDLVAYVSNGVAKKKEDGEDVSSLVRERYVSPISAAVNFSGRDPFLPLSRNSSLSEALAYMAQGVHRVPILDMNNCMAGILSQMDMLSLLYASSDFAGLTSKKLRSDDLDLIGNVISIQSTADMWHALDLLVLQGVSGIAVVDEEGVLIGNVSASDLRHLNLYQRYMLDKTVHEVCCSKEPIVCDLDDTLETAITKLLEHHIHRVWLVDTNKQPTGVLTVTTVLRFLYDTLEANRQRSKTAMDLSSEKINTHPITTDVADEPRSKRARK